MIKANNWINLLMAELEEHKKFYYRMKHNRLYKRKLDAHLKVVLSRGCLMLVRHNLDQFHIFVQALETKK